MVIVGDDGSEDQEARVEYAINSENTATDATTSVTVPVQSEEGIVVTQSETVG